MERGIREEDLEIIKSVSEAKLQILEKYISAWSSILGTKNDQLVYIDAFAGSGLYRKMGRLNEIIEGSPLRVLRIVAGTLHDMIKKETIKHTIKIRLFFVEKNKRKAITLKRRLEELFSSLNIYSDVGKNITFEVYSEDSKTFVGDIIKNIPPTVPTFLFIDPYGYPFPLPMINHFMTRRKTEVLLNLMWFRINIDMGSEDKTANRELLTRMFGHNLWETERFVGKHGKQREEDFIKYVLQQFVARYKLAYKVGYGPEDKIKGKDKRTKYYLIHLTNHPKGAVEMKRIIKEIGDFRGKGEFSSKRDMFYDKMPDDKEFVKSLKDRLVRNYIKYSFYKGLTFMQLLAETADWKHKDAWLYENKHYRNALRDLENDGRVLIITHDGRERKRKGIEDQDIIVFLPPKAAKKKKDHGR